VLVNEAMTTRGYKIAVGVTVFLIFAILAAPYLRPYLDDAFASVTSSSGDPDAPARHPEQLEGVYKAGRAIAAATDVGVTAIRYSELVAAMASEYSIAGDSIHDRVDRDVLASFGHALDSYRAAADVWQLKIRGERRPRPDVATFLETQGIDISDGQIKSDLDGEMQRLWGAGRARLEQANARVHPK